MSWYGGRAVALGVGLAGGGALSAFFLAGGRWNAAAAGAVVGAVTGSFAPSVYDWARDRGASQQSLQAAVESSPGESFARLLDPRLERVGFVGRERELADLVAWCHDDQAGRLRLVTGPGGVGKTRLAVELMRRMSGRGWRCERVAYGQETAIIAALRGLTRKRVLLVVDYAETRAGLGRMLTVLSTGDGAGVRVLLLARSAGEWWEQLGVGQPVVWDMTQAAKAAEVVLSPAVAADLCDADIVYQAMVAFARELGVPERTVQLSGGSGAERRRVLDLHAAALVALLGEPGPGAGPVRVDVGSVLGELLRHEMHFL